MQSSCVQHPSSDHHDHEHEHHHHHHHHHHVPEAVIALINQASVDSGLVRLLDHLLISVRAIASSLRHGEASHEAAGTQNVFGDHQLHVDVVTDEGAGAGFCPVTKFLNECCGLVSGYAKSAEQRTGACRII
jgi:fructose-1,6-bisphosphatase